jgi:hypothetical protein
MKLTKENLKQIIKEEYEEMMREEYEEVMKEDLGVDINELATYILSLVKMGAQLSPLLLAFSPKVQEKLKPVLDALMGDYGTSDKGDDNE